MREAVATLNAPERGDAPRPTNITYAVYDIHRWSLGADFGALTSDNEASDMWATVRMRVGDYAFDNTHHMPNDQREFWRLRGSLGWVTMPADASPAVARRIFREETDRRYVRAATDLGAVKAAQAVATAPQDPSPDLSQEEPEVAIRPLSNLSFDAAPWRERLRRVSKSFTATPALLGGNAWAHASDETRLTVTSEGTVIQEPERSLTVGLRAWTRSADGTDLSLQWDAWTPDPAKLPSEAELMAHAADLATRVEALRAASPAEPYVGPMLISGRAAGVLFHEVLGHPLEGHRQREEEEAQTFRTKVGEAILPPFISVICDPTLKVLDGMALSGAYEFDDEGVRGQRVVLAQAGILKGFLLSRRPVMGFAHSNGHGRGEAGFLPVARQSNLLVETSVKFSEAELRQKLRDLAHDKGLPYGLYVSEVSRGEAHTERGEPNAFNVTPVEVFRIWVDGRPDELVRGVELVGTPLAALQKIVAAGDKPQVFNGTCGAESGWVPVSASSPALLLAEVEVQRSAKSTWRPPILPPPGAELKP